jgi:hypothetical protein
MQNTGYFEVQTTFTVILILSVLQNHILISTTASTKQLMQDILTGKRFNFMFANLAMLVF